MSEDFLQISGLCKNFGSLAVLKNVTFSVRRGEVVAVIGPSGSGKSTLLRCLIRLETMQRGSVALAGRALVRQDADGRSHYPPESETRPLLRKMGMVFQSFNLFPHRNVLENIIAAPLTVARQPREEAIAAADRLLAKVGLTDKRLNYPFELSGGQKQRVAIARALAMNPEIMLFDEPTSALDPELTGEVLRTMRDLAEEKMTMLVVTHEMSFARGVAGKIIFMDGGEVIEEGAPAAVLDNPRHPRAKAFFAQTP
ncbi:MAG: amino acid ABC transporter ATP-binding protein [Gracilibacteraceae bacterium]|jgi:polar amino acid transport system ATP-binding protein|nr:amino acid ABC transporter ATP-binding protein [Gracilibacteraceae bacterium]